MAMEQFKEWLNNNQNADKLILTDNTENINRLIRRYNFEQTDVFNLNVTGILDQAMNVLMIENSHHHLPAPQLIDNDAAVLLVKKIIETSPDIYTFVPKQCYSITTFSEVLRCMNILRCEETNEQYAGETGGKILQLKQLIEEYEETLKAYDLYDPITLLHQALNSSIHIEYEQCGFVEFGHITALEKRFVDRFFPNAVNLKWQQENKCAKRFVKAYGIANEISGVADDILTKSISLGDVSLIYSNRQYDHLIEAIFKEKGIDFSFTSERISDSSSLVKIIQALLLWYCSDYDYAILKNLIYTEGFRIEECDAVKEYNRAIKRGVWFGSARYFEDELWNRTYPIDAKFVASLQQIIRMLEKHNGQITLGNFLSDLLKLADQFCCDYADKEKEKKKIAKLARALNSITYQCDLQQAAEYLNDKLKSLMFSESADNQKVDVVMIKSTPLVLSRAHNYFIGLSDSHFTSSTVQSPVLSDELLQYCLKDADCLLAANNEQIHQNAYNQSIDSIKGDAWFSYSYFDTVKMSAQAPSAYFSSLVEKNDGRIEEINEYQDKVTDPVIVEGKQLFDNDFVVVESLKNETQLKLSPTALNTLMECPLRYYYQYIRHLNMDEAILRDETQWLQANETGTFFHNLMEGYMNQEFVGKNNIPEKLNQPLFDQLFNAEKVKTIQAHPYPNSHCCEEELKKLKDAAVRYLEQMHKEFSNPDNPWKVLGCEINLEEKNFHVKVIDDVKAIDVQIKGFADRVDYREDEKGRHYRIIDYKTGKRKKQADKVKKGKTCQHDLYQMVIAHAYGWVDEFDYVFPFEKNGATLTVTDFAEGLPEKAEEAIKDFYNKHLIVPEEGAKAADLGCEYCILRHQCMFYTTRKD